MDTGGVCELLDQVRSGNLTRRHFVERMAQLGVVAPLASMLLVQEGLAQSQPAFSYKGTRRGGGGTLRILVSQGVTGLNPRFAPGLKDLEGSRPFYEPLAYYDRDGKLEPVLATEVPTRQNGGVAADGLSTTWKLKPGVTWHDGTPFGADDVVFNWQFAVDPATASGTSGAYTGVKVVEKVDALTVRVVFERPSPLSWRAANVQLIPRHVFATYQGARAREAPANLKPIGTGPYRIAEFRPGDLIRGTLNPTYHAPNRPFFDAIEIKGGGDSASAARAVLQTGEFDFANSLLVEDDVLRSMEGGSSKGRLEFLPTGWTTNILLNTTDPNTEIDGERSHPSSRHPVFSDPAVRYALGLLLDRQSIQKYLYGRLAVATPNFLNNPTEYNSPNLKMEFSIDKANDVLESAGWKRGADGIRAKDGRRLHFLFQATLNSLTQKVQAIYKQACSKAGVELELKAVTAAVLFSSDPANPDTAGKFWADLEMLTYGRQPDPDRYMQNGVSWEASRKANKWLGINIPRWSNQEYDRLFRASEGELDPVKRAALFIRMNDIVCRDGYVLPIVVRQDAAALARTLVAPLTGWDPELSAIHDWYRI